MKHTMVILYNIVPGPPRIWSRTPPTRSTCGWTSPARYSEHDTLAKSKGLLRCLDIGDMLWLGKGEQQEDVSSEMPRVMTDTSLLRLDQHANTYRCPACLWVWLDQDLLLKGRDPAKHRQRPGKFGPRYPFTLHRCSALWPWSRRTRSGGVRRRSPPPHYQHYCYYYYYCYCYYDYATVHIHIYIYIYTHIISTFPPCGPPLAAELPSPRTSHCQFTFKNLEFQGFRPVGFFILRGGVPRSGGSSPEVLPPRFSAGGSSACGFNDNAIYISLSLSLSIYLSLSLSIYIYVYVHVCIYIYI